MKAQPSNAVLGPETAQRLLWRCQMQQTSMAWAHWAALQVTFPIHPTAPVGQWHAHASRMPVLHLAVHAAREHAYGSNNRSFLHRWYPVAEQTQTLFSRVVAAQAGTISI